MAKCPNCQVEIVYAKERGVMSESWMGETLEEYGATPETNRSREVYVSVYRCPQCGYEQEENA